MDYILSRVCTDIESKELEVTARVARTLAFYTLWHVRWSYTRQNTICLFCSWNSQNKEVCFSLRSSTCYATHTSKFLCCQSGQVFRTSTRVFNRLQDTLARWCSEIVTALNFVLILLKFFTKNRTLIARLCCYIAKNWNSLLESRARIKINNFCTAI